MSFAHVMRRTFGALNRILYRTSGGKVGGTLKGAPILLLTTKGRKSGKVRTMPLLYLRDDGRLVLVASSGGSAGHPGWYRNLSADPDVEVEIGRERTRMRARTATPEERARLWPQVVDLYSGYESYQRKTSREIPVVILEPA